MINNITLGLKKAVMVPALALAAVMVMGCSVTSFAATKVACMGDSLTRGYLLENPGESYPSQLQKMLGFDYEVKNFGYSSSYVIDDGPLEYIDTPMYRDSVAYDGDILIFMFGTNDIRAYDWTAKYFENQYAKVVNTYLMSNKKHKIFFIIPPETRDYYFGIQRDSVDPVKKVAARFGATVIDSCNLALGHPEYYMEDKVHMTGAFYEKLAQLVASAVKGEVTGEMIEGAEYIYAPEETIPSEVQQENNVLYATAKAAKEQRDIEYKPYIDELLAKHPNYETTGIYN
ncbi:GDSL-type esterase/lipase family protein [Oribacterium sp. FC2011]|uniref:GDSL-type esterase/lipase family protein n=1 Tax=Oribacterium sp. FC2011 TaxID=1408311 RepID=UPI0004E1E953|nr:GDSL-type esterase/lipase family protein [Oribacterium sp. FC2011]